MLLAGYDKDEGASLYFIDYLASLHKMNFACQGYAGYFLLSIFDKHWKPNMTEAEGLKLIEVCIQQLRTRFVLNNPRFLVKIVDKNGYRTVPISQHK